MTTGNEPANKLAETIDEARAASDQDKQHLVGMGFVGWVLDMFNSTSDPRLTTVLDKSPAVIWLAFGKDLGKYVAQVRAHNATRDHKAILFVNVNTVDEAICAANEWKVDVLVVQGMNSSKNPLLSFNIADCRCRGRRSWKHTVSSHSRVSPSRP